MDGLRFVNDARQFSSVGFEEVPAKPTRSGANRIEFDARVYLFRLPQQETL